MVWHDNRSWAAAAAALLIAAACQAAPTPSLTAGPAPTPTPLPTATLPGPTPIAEIGPGEGALNLIVRPGYAESGANDATYDWITPFEKETGCTVSAFEAGTSDQILSKAKQEGGAEWDGLSAPGDATLRLIGDGLVQPVDVEALFPAWQQLWPPLQGPDHNTVNGIHYGVSHGWAANLLMWNASVVQPAPTSWQVVYDLDTPFKGRVTAYDSAISIADAALYLSTARPDLGILDPYELSRSQFDAAVELLKAQRPLVGAYWGTPLDEISDFRDQTAVLGAAWPNQLRVLQTEHPPVPVEAMLPVEGATARADTWLLVAGAKHPNCMLRWMAWVISPEVQKQVAEYAAEAPANLESCRLLDEHPGPFGFGGFCAFHHAADEVFAREVRFWKTPLSDCGDGRVDECVDYSVWLQQWDEIKAAG